MNYYNYEEHQKLELDIINCITYIKYLKINNDRYSHLYLPVIHQSKSIELMYLLRKIQFISDHLVLLLVRYNLLKLYYNLNNQENEEK